MGWPKIKLWADADDATLRQLAEEGKSFSEIGAVIGRTRNACIGRAHRIGVIKGGAREPSQHPDAVRARAARAGLPPPPKPPRAPVERLFAPKQDNTPKPLYPLPEASTTAYGVPRVLLDLEPHHCRFAFGERAGQHLFCCADRLPGKAWCADHHALVFRPSDRRDLSGMARAYR